jgi:hypothetical protein
VYRHWQQRNNGDSHGKYNCFSTQAKDRLPRPPAESACAAPCFAMKMKEW